MNRSALLHQIKRKQSVLCLGLDPSLDKIPTHLLHKNSIEEAVYEFCMSIVLECQPHIVAVKPNFAFFESIGSRGIELLQKIIAHLPDDLFIIGDGKRGDIGNTSSAYAKAGFDILGCHALTINPFMGEDSVVPFLQHPDKWGVVLGLTSNHGANDFQMLEVEGRPLYLHVMTKVASWGTPENLMFVVGATRPALLKTIRTLFPDHFFLVPGIGAQGGDLEEVMQAGLNKDAGLLINASRAILYAGSDSDYAKKSKIEAQNLHQIMRNFL